jgi:hypothetical protein
MIMGITFIEVSTYRETIHNAKDAEPHQGYATDRSSAVAAFAFIWPTQRKHQPTSAYKLADAAGRHSAPEQNDQNHDHQYQAEAPAIVMEWRANIEAATTEKENENNQ